MKRLFLSLIAMIVLTLSASAMSYEEARQQALFLTDKMAYELNLTEAQYQAAYEVNLDYLMSVTTASDLYGIYWTQRNTDLSYILLDWQYRNYLRAAYFYRPLAWTRGAWSFVIYNRYPRRDYFYYSRPVAYSTYRGTHSWRYNGGRSWYQGRTFVPKNQHRGNFGGRNNTLSNSWQRSYRSNRSYQNNSGNSFGGQTRKEFNSNVRPYPHQSSTRVTVRQPNSNRGSFGGATRSFPSNSASRLSQSGFGSSSGSSFGGHR